MHHAVRFRTTLALGAVALALACKKAEQPQQAATPPQPRTLLIHAADFNFTAPDTVFAGMTSIQVHNMGRTLHHAQLLRIDSGRTFDSLAAALRRPHGFPAPWLAFAGGPNAAAPNDTVAVVQDLAPGHYAIVCVIPDSTGAPHMAHGMIRPLEVVPAPAGTANAAAPTADIEIMTADYAFTESKAITAGTHTIKITNNGPQPHEAVFIRLDSGATIQQVSAWVGHNMRGAPPRMIRPAGGMVAIMPGMSAYYTMNFQPGTYGLICFIPDMHDGKGHDTKGMMKQFTVS